MASAVGLEVVTDWRGNPRIRFPFRRDSAAADPVFYQDRAMYRVCEPKWMAPRGKIPCPFEAWRMEIAHQDRTVYICEGLPDVVAVLHYWPEAPVVGIPGAGAFKPEWAPLFRGITRVIVISDNDTAGLKLRETVLRVLDPVVWPTDIYNLFVPQPHKDIDEWRKADPGNFPDHFLDVMDRTLRRLKDGGCTGRLGGPAGARPCDDVGPPEDEWGRPEEEAVPDNGEGVDPEGHPSGDVGGAWAPP